MKISQTSQVKAQIAFEFLMLVGTVFLFIAIYLVVASDQIEDYQKRSEDYIINDFGNMIYFEIKLASIVKNGYTREFELPIQIDDRIDYNISVVSNTLYITTPYQTYIKSIPKINGVILPGKNKILKLNEQITIENI